MEELFVFQGKEGNHKRNQKRNERIYLATRNFDLDQSSALLKKKKKEREEEKIITNFIASNSTPSLHYIPRNNLLAFWPREMRKQTQRGEGVGINLAHRIRSDGCESPVYNDAK